MAVCEWCEGARKVPQFEAGDTDCPACGGTGTDDLSKATEAVESALIAMRAHDFTRASLDLATAAKYTARIPEPARVAQ